MDEPDVVLSRVAAVRRCEAGLIEGAWWEDAGPLTLISLGIPVFWGQVAMAVREPPDPAAALANARRRFGDAPMAVQVVAERMPAVEAAARGLGLAPRDLPTLVRAMAGDEHVAPPRGYTIERVRDAAALDELIATVSAGFGEDPALTRRRHPPRMLSEPRMPLFLARDSDGRPAAAARAFIDGGSVAVLGVTTLPKHRRRGLARALTMTVIDAGASVGAAVAWLNADDDDAPVYERLGFRRIATLRMFVPE